MAQIAKMERRWQLAIMLLVAGLLASASFFWYLAGAYHAENNVVYHEFAFPNFRFTNIITVYVNHRLERYDGPGFIFSGTGIDYPALLSMMIRALASVGNPLAYYWLNLPIVLPATLLCTWLIARWPGANPWLFAASPLLFLYTFFNWDVIPIALSVGSLLLLRESLRRPDVGRAFNLGLEIGGFALLGTGICFKLFPIVFFGAALIDRLRRRQWLSIGLAIGTVGLILVAINLPLALANYKSWDYFLWFNAHRTTEPSLWYWLLGGMVKEQAEASGVTAVVNRYSVLLVVAGGLVIAALAFFSRRREVAMPTAACLLLWWFAFNKIYDPNFDIWVLALLALLAAPFWLYASFSVFAFFSWIISFEWQTLAISGQQELFRWHSTHAMFYNILLRWVFLFFLIGWTARKVWQSAGEKQPSAEVGKLTVVGPS